VLMVVDSLGNGGAERQMALLASVLDGEWEASVVALTDGPFRQTLEESGVHVTVLRRAVSWDVRPAFEIWRMIRSSRPLVIHTWGWMSSLAVLSASLIEGIPLVNGSIRRSQYPRRRGLITKFSCRMSRIVVANSRAGLTAYRIPDRLGRVVHNGFDAARVAESGFARRFEEGPCVVVMTARMSVAKDHALLVRCARELQRRDPGRWRFVVLGDGPLRESVMTQAADLVDAGVMEFPDPTLEVIGHVQCADVGVLFTHGEGISNSIMEYMACGLPVVASDVGGTPELVVDGVTGILVPPGDTDGAAEALSALRSDRSRARSMGEAGRKRILDEFSVDRLKAHTVEVYVEALEPRSR
jgi:glycosyltransferase involved in cell wall biosynthesis